MSDQTIPRNKITKTIPWELVSDILKRLPVKDLVRFKCVSKGWFSQIGDPSFIKRHTNKSTINLILKDRKTGKLFSAGFDNCDNLQNPRELKHPFTRIESTSEGSGPEYTEIMGSCNGLIFLVNETYGTNTMVLWNMSTGDYKVLPDLPVVVEYKVSTDFPRITIRSGCKTFYGFGYDSITDDYKVVRIVQNFESEDITEVRVYSLKANIWGSWSEEEIPDDYYLYPLTRKRDATFVNGALHWVVKRKEDDSTCVMALDVGSEEYHEIEVLEDMKDRPDAYYRMNFGEFEFRDLGVLGGCLCMLSWCAPGHYDELWVMKDYGVEESWTCLFRVENLKYGLPHKLHPLAYSKDHDKILLASYWYHIEDNDDDDKVPTSPWFEKISRDENFVLIPQLKNMESLLSDICVGSLVQLGD